MSKVTPLRRLIGIVAMHVMAVLAFAVPHSTVAATIRQIGTADLINASKLIVHGLVVDKWAESGSVQGSIVTRVQLQVKDVIKGQSPNSLITLSFLGGTLGNLEQYVAGSNVPEIGEEGIYFLENPDRFLVNPFVGWTQGHFIVDQADQRVQTYAGDKVFEMRLKSGPAQLEFADRHAYGVIVEPTNAHTTPMHVDEFVSELRLLIGRQK